MSLPPGQGPYGSSDPYGARSAFDPPDDGPDDLPYGSPDPYRPSRIRPGDLGAPAGFGGALFGDELDPALTARLAARRRWLRRMFWWSAAGLFGWTIVSVRVLDGTDSTTGPYRFMDATTGPVAATLGALVFVAAVGFVLAGRLPRRPEVRPARRATSIVPWPGRRLPPAGPAWARGWPRVAAGVLAPLLAVAVVTGAVAVVADHVREPSTVSSTADGGPQKAVAVAALASIGVNPAQVSVAYGAPDNDPALFTDVVGVAPSRRWQASIYPYGPSGSGEAFIDVYRLAPGSTAAQAWSKVDAWFHTKDDITSMTAVTSKQNPAGWTVALEGKQPVRYLDFAAAEDGYLLWGEISPDLNTPDKDLLASGRPLMRALSANGIAKFGEMTAP